MLETRLDTTDFGRRVPAVRLAVACLAFGALGLIFALETRNAFKYGTPITTGFVVERVGITLMLAAAFSLIVLHLLLPFRLRFTEAGLLRRTLLRPRFVPWQSVTAATLGSLKGNVILEIRATGRRLPMLVPVMEYRRAATLLAALRRRLPVEIRDPGNFAARLTDG